MKAVTKKALIAGLTLLTMMNGLSAEDTEQSQTTEDNVLINSRPMSPEQSKLMKAKRIAELQSGTQIEAEEMETQLSGLIIPIKWQNCGIPSSDDMICSTASSYSPHLYHWVDSFPAQNVLKLEDGSEWSFSVDEAYIARSWRGGDTVVISPKSSWFWSYDYSYVLTNKSLGSYIDVNPFVGPVAWGPYTVWVAGIDYTLGQVYLVNGQGERSTWVINSSDIYLFKDWAVNDTILIGDNDSWLWWFSSYNHALINVNMNHYLRAREI
ncbi:MAG: hypothetical protein K940chlam2_00431 [Chlamydiae bacterium]|nr:hypothetical protein [Chlamydiota bacterium]